MTAGGDKTKTLTALETEVRTAESNLDDTDYVLLERLKQDYRRSLRTGGKPDIEEYVDAHPALASELRSVLPAIEMVESLLPEGRVGLPGKGDQLGDFVLLHELGRGGSGIVYEAENQATGDRVAIKVFSQNSSLNARAEVEARITQKLQHPSIVPTYEFVDDGDVTYIIMELIRGVSLQSILDQESDGEPPYPIGDLDGIAIIGADLASALECAHSNDVLHRDVKPGNMLVAFDGAVWLTDFGCAKKEDVSAPVTQTGYVLGTIRYMSPEHLEGKPSEQSDIYGLGLSLRELLLRSKKHVKDRDQFQRLEKIIDKACQRDAALRYLRASDFENDLVEFVCGRLTKSGRTGIRLNAARLGVAVTIVACFFAGWLLGQMTNESQEEQTPILVPRATVVKDPTTGLSRTTVSTFMSNDDAEEFGDGEVYVSSTDLEMVWDETPQVVGLRFADIPVPQGAKIEHAAIQFHCDEADVGMTQLVLQTQIVDDASPFEDVEKNISLRTRSQARVDWSPEPWSEGTRLKHSARPTAAPLCRKLSTRKDGPPEMRWYSSFLERDVVARFPPTEA